MADLGITLECGNAILKKGKADLVSLGRQFIANADLVERFKYNPPSLDNDRGTFSRMEMKNHYIVFPKSSEACFIENKRSASCSLESL